MVLYKRPKVSGNYPKWWDVPTEGEPIYESVEEALTHGIPAGKIFGRGNWVNAKAGDYIQYDDGKVTRAIYVWSRFKYTMRNTPIAYKNRPWVNIYTALNRFFADRKREIFAEFGHYRGETARLAETIESGQDQVTIIKARLVERWLLEGMSLVEAVSKDSNLRKLASKWADSNRDQFNNQEIVRYFAYHLISQPWFSKLLEQNRVFRDKYMSIVGVLETVGLTKEVIAQELKKQLQEGTEKQRINALNKAVDILVADESRIKPNAKLQGIEANYTVGEEDRLLTKGNGQDESKRISGETAEDTESALSKADQSEVLNELRSQAGESSFSPEELLQIAEREIEDEITEEIKNTETD